MRRTRGSLLGLPGSRRGSQCRRASSEMHPLTLVTHGAGAISMQDMGAGGWAGLVGGWGLGWAGGGAGLGEAFQQCSASHPWGQDSGRESLEPAPASSLKSGFRVGSFPSPYELLLKIS